jgi:Protein of unknown function (DUF2924)
LWAAVVPAERQPSPIAALPDAVADPMQTRSEPDANLADLRHLSRSQLRDLWQKDVGETPPGSFGREVLALGIAYVRQERRYGGLRKASVRELDRLFERMLAGSPGEGGAPPLGRPGTILVREWQGTTHHVTVVADGFIWNGRTHSSLSGIARAITGTKWNGPRFFGLARRNGTRTRNNNKKSVCPTDR